MSSFDLADRGGTAVTTGGTAKVALAERVSDGRHIILFVKLP